MTILCFIMVKAFNTAKKLELYYALTLLWYVLLAIWGIQQKLGGNVRMEGLGGTQLPDVNSLASVYILYFPLTYYSVFSKKKWVKLYIAIPSFVIFVVFILFGGSRGAFLGLALCLAYIFVRSKGLQKIKMVFTFIILGALLVGTLSQLAPEGFFDEYTARLTTMLGQKNETTGETKREASASGRTAMWKGAIYIYRNHPEYWLMGVGMNSYRLMYMRHIDELAGYLDSEELTLVLFGGHGGKDIHNTFLSVLLGGGMFVFVPWVFLILYAWRQACIIPKKYPRIVDGVDIHNYARALEIGILGYCLCVAFLTMEFNDIFYWHLTMVGVITNLGKAKLKREELGQEEEEWGEEPRRSFAYSS